MELIAEPDVSELHPIIRNRTVTYVPYNLIKTSIRLALTYILINKVLVH